MHPARRNAAEPEPDHCPACSSRLLWADRVLVCANTRCARWGEPPDAGEPPATEEAGE